LKKRVQEVVRNIFDQERFTSSSGLGDILMHSLHLSLVTGHGYMAPLRVRLPEFSERVRSKYVRQTLKGSIGVWRFSDVCDLSLTQYTEDELIKNRIQRIASYFGGMPFSQSSLEGRNKIVKEDFDRTPRKIVELLNEFRVYWSDEIRSYFERYGFSYVPLPYGSGTNNRYHFHSQSISEGMLYVGYSLGSDSCYDQRKIFINDVSISICT